MIRKFAPVIAFFILGVSPAHAQSDFSALHIDLGDRIYVVQVSGVEVGGPVTGLTPSRLSIGQYEFKPEPGLRIERSGDPLWNGFFIGAGVGVLGGLVSCSEPECAVAGAVVYGLFGALVDWAHVGRTKIYQIREAPAVAKRSVRIAPVLTSDRRTVRVTLSF